MRDLVYPRETDGFLDGRPPPARAGEPVSDDPRDFDPQAGVVLADSDGDDAQMMAHEPETTPTTVAALYVDPEGVYANHPGVEVWDEARDARLYAGPWPVVAHPPCNKWSPLAYINQRRLPDYRIGDDGGCFAAALAAVRRFGGVLEHPAVSLAWKAHGLTRPRRGAWSFPSDKWAGRVTEVDQGVYGHRARKRTWLYVVSPALHLPPLDWREATSDVCVSGFLHHTGTDESRRVRPHEASATPERFRDVLVTMSARASP